jgi:hypothetical protein
MRFPLVSDCRLYDQGSIKFVSVVNNKVSVVVMLQIQVMYIIFHLYRKTLKITSVIATKLNLGQTVQLNQLLLPILLKLSYVMLSTSLISWNSMDS